MVPSSRFPLAGARPGRSAPPQMTERSELRAAFDEEASRWRQEFEDRDDEAGERKDLASRWQQYSETAQDHYSATLTTVDNPKRNHTVGNLWWNKGLPPSQATLALKRGSTDMNSMFDNMKKHPLAVGSDGMSNWMILDGKVNAQSKVDQHESMYNVKLTTILGFNLTVGYSRFKDPEGRTHAWVAFGDHCTFQWQWELGVIVCR